MPFTGVKFGAVRFKYSRHTYGRRSNTDKVFWTGIDFGI